MTVSNGTCPSPITGQQTVPSGDTCGHYRNKSCDLGTMLRTFQWWRLHPTWILLSVWHCTLWTEWLLVSDQLNISSPGPGDRAGKGRWGAGKRSRSANLGPGRELTREVAVNLLFLPRHSVSGGSAAAALPRLWQQVFEIACSSYYISALFSNYTLPFEYSVCFKYLENANFFIYSCLKKLRLCCLPWVIQ